MQNQYIQQRITEIKYSKYITPVQGIVVAILFLGVMVISGFNGI